MITAFISDIHSNIEALHAVLADIESRNIERIVCLGDIVNYGPDPAACLDIIRTLDLSLLGNHEEAILTEPVGFNPVAEQAAYWTQAVLAPQGRGRAAKQVNWDFLVGLPREHKEGGMLLVHASPREPTSEYLLPTDVDPILGQISERLRANFKLVDQVCFVGHTHLPGVFSAAGGFVRPDECDNEFHVLKDDKVICNVGSVGQPRDRNRDACYIIYDGDVIRYHRVRYDAETTCAKVKSVKDLPDWCGTRLLKGE